MRVSSTDLQNSFGKYLALVEKEDIIVVKNGKTVAKLIPYSVPEYVVLREEAKEYKTMRRISYEEYLELTKSSDQRYELIDGVVYLLASPSFSHQVVVNEIAWHFHNYFRGKPCRSLTAPLDVRLQGYALKFEEDPNIVQPDIVVICDEDNVNEAGQYQGVPSLIVEVVSPSTRSKDTITKLNLYMKSGVPEYWIVDMDSRTITQYFFTEDRELNGVATYADGDRINSTRFAGLELDTKELFAVLG
ncbi:MAG: type II toxin-antitoxin system prevent-host-death family antitoxin [Firmicutes bacterium]|nr:type II toxin-antitoxin system prevent-host-death family antitoxin [Bacillota bacterium]